MSGVGEGDDRVVEGACRPWARWVGYAAVVVAVGYAVLSLYWAFGGEGLLSTVGGWPERVARRHDAGALVLGLLSAAAKLTGAGLALALTRTVRWSALRRLLVRLAGIAACVLVVYGGVLVTVGALVLAGAVEPAGPVDRTALRWHVLVWDMWFLLWGLLLGLTVLGRRQPGGQHPAVGS